MLLLLTVLGGQHLRLRQRVVISRWWRDYEKQARVTSLESICGSLGRVGRNVSGSEIEIRALGKPQLIKEIPRRGVRSKG